MSGRQRTLFQTWGPSLVRGAGAAGCGQARSPATVAEALQEEEDDDDVMLVAAYEAEQQLDPEDGGFCAAAGGLWIYPTNCPVRDYQLHISRTALFCNTLVCLPTGLGKTFIAAVVMYNFYRWFPSGKVVFMAPTKPLVTQQMEACFHVMGIPQSHMAEMTGSTQAVNRKEVWCSKRVLFLTPQVMVNDLTRGACPAAHVKCLVVDEAHKALGNYAYCQVVRELVKYTTHFRILALSATPGSDIKAVQQVITNLLIGKVELRSEDSPDILPYSHERRVEKLVVPLGEELGAIQKTYIRILETFASCLIQRNVLMKRDIPNLTKYQIILARDQFRKNPSPNIVGIQGVIEGEFATCISLYHGYELLQQMGMRSLYFFLSGIMDGTKGMTWAKNELSRNEDFMQLYSRLESMFAHMQDPAASNALAFQKGNKEKTFFYSHPKLKKLEEIIIEHFRSWNAKNTAETKCPETRVMIFSSFRDSVEEIAEMLSRHQPLIRVMTFVGHASGKNTKGFTQKEQLQVVRRFRDGGYNTLVSTCVGEEGLDIGEVDLIICFDAQKSPIRLIQRMGRTGRKRQGRIVVILAEGREERTYNQSQSNKRSIYKAISGDRQVLHFYQGSPRMVPENVNPELHKMFITHGAFEPEKARDVRRKPSSSRTGVKAINKDGFLSEEEFNLWKRLYRLGDGDQVKGVELPESHFPSLQEDTMPKEPTAGIRQLSLSEWRLWQDHPLPTHQVDHSDRCHHFISVMQMIEEMRQEEDECSYERKIKPFLRMEDVRPTCNTPRNAYKNLASVTTITHKPSVRPSAGEGCSSSSSVIVSDDETSPKCTETALREKASGAMGKDLAREESNEAAASPNICGHSAEAVSRIDPLNGESVAGAGGITAVGTVSDDDSHPGASLTECRAADKSRSFARYSLDSGYSSFSDEKSVSSNLFLPLEEELCPDMAADQFYNCHPGTEEVRANVERFLSCSPPSLSGLSAVEREVTQDFEPDHTPCSPNSEREHSHKPASLTSHSAVNSQQNFEKYSVKHVSHPPENYCVFGKTDNKISDQPSCGSDNRAYNIKDKNLVSSSYANLAKNLVDENSHEDDSDPPVFANEGESLLLFEDSIGELDGAGLSPCKSNSRLPSVSDETLISEMPPISRFLISDELLLDDDSEPEDPITCDTKSWKCHEGLKDEHKGPKSEGQTFDCSADLFSITFNLGFCSSGSDDEIPGHVSGRSSTPEVAGLPGRHSDKEISGASDTADPPGGAISPIRAGNLQCPRSPANQEPASPCFPPCLPVKERVMSTPLSKANVWSLCSKTGAGKTPGSTEEKADVQRSKVTLNPRVDDLGEELKSSDHLFRLRSPQRTEVEHLTSESEDDVFLRKTKKPKANVLKSPEVSHSCLTVMESSEGHALPFQTPCHILIRLLICFIQDWKNSDVDSPVHAVKKSRVLRSELSSSDESEHSLMPCSQLEDFKDHERNARKGSKVRKKRNHVKNIARMFLDDEAEVSEEDAGSVSPDEDELENEQDSSLLDFVNDQTQLSQAINDSDMRAIYMRSVRSPLTSTKYRMDREKHNNMNIFSQIPEQDESYLEDSFCVDEEESCKSQSCDEEVCVDFNLSKDSFTEGNVRYKTRYAVKLKQMSMKQNCPRPKKKLSRIILPDDDSEEEVSTVSDREDPSAHGGTADKHTRQGQRGQQGDSGPPGSSAQLQVLSNPPAHQNPMQRHQVVQSRTAAIPEVANLEARSHHTIPSTSSPCARAESWKECGKRPAELKVDDPEEGKTSAAPRSNSPLHVAEVHPAPSLPHEGNRACILVDSREITSGLEVISSLRTVHGLQVEVCPLNGCDYIVSNRMAVERKSQAEMLNNSSKNKFIEQMQRLQGMFQRICVIVEKDREKAGDISRMFRRTKCYDSLLTALVGAGIRILFSSGQEETADLLKELSLVEQRKNVGIHVPAVLNPGKCEALQFYLSIPGISYITALNMCHRMSSVKKMANSSPEEISACAQVTHQKAEEIYRYIRCTFDMQMLPNDLIQDRLKPDACTTLQV
ncbi:Fanconi anemia group M protein isoform X2 [Chionomys nivalis]|uniref:Fanconi anemia group M protein isoform X2 n=1 Tax=Chionomys nivalis TaxID=269649 RepID=UPI0025964058|nr:Fanconi anemia group M protein isoform X2 [Chionomys nivalis]